MAPDAWYEPGGGRPPWREPEALLEYIRSSPGVDLGVNNRVWLAEKSSTLMRRSSAPAERALYREAVLLTAEKGRQAEPSVWMSEALSGGRELPFAVGPPMADEMAKTVRAMTRLVPLLPRAKRHALEQWLALAEQIRHLAPRRPAPPEEGPLSST
jgi:hypothetical protein